MKKALSICLIALLASCSSFGQTKDSSPKISIAEARQAYFQVKHKEAYALYEQVWKDQDQRKEDRVTAGRQLAKMDWLLYEQNRKAYQTLDKLQKIEHEQTLTYILRSRILENEKKYDKAIAMALKAVEVSDSKIEDYQASLAYGLQVFNKAKEEVFGGKKLSAKDQLRLTQVFEQTKTWMTEKEGDVQLAKLYLGLSLLQREGDEAFRAWMTFYRLTDSNQIHPSLMKAPKVFQQALTDYKGNDPQDIKTIIEGLAESGFFEYAGLVKVLMYGRERHPDDQIDEIMNYLAFLKNARKTTVAFYRATVNGTGSIYDFRAGFKQDSEVLWDKLKWEGDRPKFSQDLFDKTVRERFKGLISIFSANGYYGLHMGHVMLDDKRTISQYNQSAEFRFVVIDNMVSNGFTTWFWDSASQVGGWATNDASFLQVRSAYSNGPLQVWLSLTDTAFVKKGLEELETLKESDDEIARENPHAFLPGLTKRIRYYETKEILDSLRNTGLEEKALRLAFISTLERMIQGSSIYAHEGRHSIDKKNGYSSVSKELEFTAKLSEIYFSEKPLLFTTSVIAPNIGDPTSHGQGNLRVVKGIVKWMEEHQNEIAGFDASRPTLPQLDKMTDQQIKRAVRSMDPMAN